MRKKPVPVTLAEADIKSEPVLSRRTVLGTLGLGAGATAATLIGGTSPARAASDPESRGRACPFRDFDSGDTIRINCGSTDTD